jgi:hypothetical protein
VKKKQIWILVVLATMVVVALLAFAAHSFVLQASPIVMAGKAKGLGKDQIILAQAGTSALGIGKGDVFPFLLEVQYDTTQVAGIDRASLDTSVNLQPFEIRDYKETEFDVDAHTRVYRREYELQLINGKLDQAYQLPTIVVRYQLKNSDGFAEKAVVPDPILVVSRLPADVSNLELRPITDKVEDPSRDRFIWVLWAFGGLMVVGGAADLTWRVLPQWRERAKKRRKIEGGDIFIQAYRSLYQHVAMKKEPKSLLHQIDHILRLVLAQKEKAGWLEEPDLEKVSVEIQPVVTALFEKCQQAYGADGIEPADVDQTIKQLDEVLQFYFGAGEVEAWRN